MDNLSKFIDCLGIVTLSNKNIKGFEDYVSKINNHTFLSRNKIYYEKTSLENLSKNRDFLYSIVGSNRLTNYALLDNIIQFSAQATYYSLINNLSYFDKCLKCLEDDIKNIVSIIENKKISNTISIPIDKEVIDIRQIEADNKLLLYAYAKTYNNIDKDYLIITPGLGSILIGPFFKAIHNIDYKIVNYSRYKQIQNTEFKKLKHKYKKIFIIDDSVGSGLTTQEIYKLLSPSTIKISTIEYDWYIYDQVCKNKSNYFKFDLKLYDNLTFFNVRNHRFLDECITKLINNPLDYIKYLKANNFKQHNTLDLDILYSTGKKYGSHYLENDLFTKTEIFSDAILKEYKEH